MNNDVPQRIEESVPEKRSFINTLILWTTLIVTLFIMIYVVYSNYIRSDNPEVPSMFLWDQFLDIDGDGDLDFLIEGEVIMNCDGVACSDYILPAIGAQEPVPNVVPTEEVFRPEGIPTPQIYPKNPVPDPN